MSVKIIDKYNVKVYNAFRERVVDIFRYEKDK